MRALLDGNLLNVDVNLDADADIAAPINGAVAANANVAAPIDAAVAANIGSVDSEATAVSQQDAIINQDIAGSAEATRTSSPTSSSSHRDAGASTALGRDATTLRPRPGHRRLRRAPARADGVELIGEMQGSGYREPPALVRRGDGQTLQLTPLLYARARGVRRATRTRRRSPRRRGTGARSRGDNVRTLVDAQLRPLGLLPRPTGRSRR